METKKRLIVKLGYNEYAFSDTSDNDAMIMNILKNMYLLKSEYIDSGSLYHPAERQESLEFKFVNSVQFRPPTPLEAENKKISDLENDLRYAKTQKTLIEKERDCAVNELAALKATLFEEKEDGQEQYQEPARKELDNMAS